MMRGLEKTLAEMGKMLETISAVFRPPISIMARQHMGWNRGFIFLRVVRVSLCICL